MAVTAAQTKSGQGAGASVTINITTTAGNLLGISTSTFNATGAAPTRTGETNNSAVADFSDLGTDHLRGDYMMNIGGNANSVVCAPSTGTGVSGCVTEFSGAKTSLALGATSSAAVNTGGSNSTIQPGAITATAGSGLMSAQADDGIGSAASTISAGWTVDEAGGAGTVWDEAGVVGGSAHQDNTAGGSINPTWTSGHTTTGTLHKVALIMEFLAAGGTPVEQSHLTVLGVT